MQSFPARNVNDKDSFKELFAGETFADEFHKQQ
jgi:hypothetical protein